ncbi:MAG: NADH-quinone oxidoreductase subunit A [Candidatus Marsarchaeota archaeon]|jgi:NADH:ubiquinone oxidoreductase subunit 3 (subunit A)|nr:NADH-quinone oxidoreductase subunit A [Candidatus Marsarchaeota archaeon]MCL5418715.1 NADH-quinone oxidoreductase subunit A [Candidatus Marsarchaeota archaeon]
MLYNYVALVFFAAFSIAVPVLLLLVAKLIRLSKPGNAVKNAPYESGELTIGTGYDLYNEYLPYFMLFIPFEIVIVVVLLWSYAARLFSYTQSIYVLVLAVISMVMALVGYKLIGVKNG